MRRTHVLSSLFGLLFAILISGCAFTPPPAPKEVEGLPTKHPIGVVKTSGAQDFILQPNQLYTLAIEQAEQDFPEFVEFIPSYVLGITMQGRVYEGKITKTVFQIWAHPDAIGTLFTKTEHGKFTFGDHKNVGQPDDFLLLFNLADTSVYSGEYYDPYFAHNCQDCEQ